MPRNIEFAPQYFSELWKFLRDPRYNVDNLSDASKELSRSGFHFPNPCKPIEEIRRGRSDAESAGFASDVLLAVVVASLSTATDFATVTDARSWGSSRVG